MGKNEVYVKLPKEYNDVAWIKHKGKKYINLNWIEKGKLKIKKY
jgi:hypothetical protein